MDKDCLNYLSSDTSKQSVVFRGVLDGREEKLTVITGKQSSLAAGTRKTN